MLATSMLNGAGAARSNTNAALLQTPSAIVIDAAAAAVA